MNGLRHARRALLHGAWVVLAATPAALQAEPARGVFGVTVAVTGNGVFSPTIESARVADVQPGLPAHRAGIAKGDQVLELDGRRIPGATARELAPLAQGKRVGESLAVRLQRPDGSAYAVILVAEPPAAPR